MDRKNKKAQGLVEVFSWFLVLMITLVFFMLFSIPGCDGDIPEQKLGDEELSSLRAEFDLISFLRTPVIVEEAEITMAELIILRKENRDKYKSIFEEKAAEAIADLRVGCSAVVINEIPYFFGDCEDFPGAGCNNATQVIPSLDGNMSIKICIKDFWAGFI